MSEFLKSGPPSYGHWLRFVQAVAFAAVLAAASPAAAATAIQPRRPRRQPDRRLWLPPGKAFPDRSSGAQARKDGMSSRQCRRVGRTAADGLRALYWAVPADADALIVELGANDMLRGLKPENTKQALAAILDKARAAHLPTLIAGMRAAPNLGAEYDRAFNAIYPASRKLRRRALSVLPRRGGGRRRSSISPTACIRPPRASTPSSNESSRRSSNSSSGSSDDPVGPAPHSDAVVRQSAGIVAKVSTALFDGGVQHSRRPAIRRHQTGNFLHARRVQPRGTARGRRASWGKSSRRSPPDSR